MFLKRSFAAFALSMILVLVSPNVLAKGKSASELAEDKAIALTEKTKEVRDWEKAFGPRGVNPATQGRPGFDIESHHGSVYVVHVFEDKPEQALTFARYQVNIKTGSVKKVE